MPTNTGIWHNNMKALFNFDILEIQQSYISEEDILKSFDTNKYGKDIIWLIDGNSGITIDKLSTGNYLVIFIDDWKYKSFNKTYKYIHYLEAIFDVIRKFLISDVHFYILWIPLQMNQRVLLYVNANASLTHPSHV